MRRSVLLTVATLALLCGAGLFFLRNRGDRPISVNSSEPATVGADDNNPGRTQTSTGSLENPAGITAPVTVGRDAQSAGRPGAAGGLNEKARTAKGQLLEDRHRDAVENRTSELMELAMGDDTNDLHTILSELNNADPEIRQAALDATIQFGSTNAIPALESAALWNENAEEKQQIADAIEFLKLPQLGDPKFPITGSSKGPARKPLPNRKPAGTNK
jgi:hypothetical protein